MNTDYLLTPTEEATNEEAAFTPFMDFCGSYCPSCRGVCCPSCRGCVLEEALDPCQSLNSHLGNGSGDLGSALRREWTAADRAARAYRAAGYTDEHTIDGGA